MTRKEQLTKIKEWISKAKLKEAVDALLNYANSYRCNDSIRIIRIGV